MRHQLLRLAILAAWSTAVAAQPGPRQCSREWYAQFSGPFSQPVAPFSYRRQHLLRGGREPRAYLVTTPEGHPEPDIVLVGHPETMFAGTIGRMRKGDRSQPLLNGPEAWTRQLAASEAAFERRVAQEESRR